MMIDRMMLEAILSYTLIAIPIVFLVLYIIGAIRAGFQDLGEVRTPKAWKKEDERWEREINKLKGK